MEIELNKEVCLDSFNQFEEEDSFNEEFMSEIDQNIEEEEEDEDEDDDEEEEEEEEQEQDYVEKDYYNDSNEDEDETENDSEQEQLESDSQHDLENSNIVYKKLPKKFKYTRYQICRL